MCKRLRYCFECHKINDCGPLGFSVTQGAMGFHLKCTWLPMCLLCIVLSRLKIVKFGMVPNNLWLSCSTRINNHVPTQQSSQEAIKFGGINANCNLLDFGKEMLNWEISVYQLHRRGGSLFQAQLVEGLLKVGHKMIDCPASSGSVF